ncbi:MAG: peptide-methionine (S)-S-oxide reductase MsrA [Gemmatimonadaceae bacterium]|nr:peptide-methionine (S)-S-oxide reductase MsrA [Gemmatimonadaceae bacterium]
MTKATFGAGCFWGVEAAFRQIPGVSDAVSGYSGGTTVNPTYKDVCTGTTGHAEAVEVAYDPARVTYQQLLDAFWKMHDPTTRDRQGPDVGSQYRSVIFYHDDEQKRLAEESKAAQDASKLYRGPIVTLIGQAGPFYEAEDYHQRYLERRGMVSCKV